MNLHRTMTSTNKQLDYTKEKPMKYVVYVEGYKTGVVIVEAQDQEEAEQNAVDMAVEGDIEWNDYHYSCFECDVVEVSAQTKTN